MQRVVWGELNGLLHAASLAELVHFALAEAQAHGIRM
jgi:hypothetical protein